METKSEHKKKNPRKNILIFIATVIIVFLTGLFASSIIERRSETKLYFQKVKPIPSWESRNEVWGENFPREYSSFKETTDTTFRSRHGGSATTDYLAESPELCVLWAGYAFSKDYKQGRGHSYAVEDIRNTLRTVQPQPGTCWSCKSPDVPRVMNKIGIKDFYHSKWADLGPEIINPTGCADCHLQNKMTIRISRPALIEALDRQGIDIYKSTQQETRSLVCAQCHVEYYFKGEGKYLTFPWDKGYTADSMEVYYDNAGFSDFTHSLSKAKIIKAQHPDYEMWSTGIHADRDVSCADCHMPYKREGAVKYTDHKIQSPLNNIAGSCGVCHRESEEKLRNNVYGIQDKVAQVLKAAQMNLAATHLEAKLAWDNNASETGMKPVLLLIRHSQWRWDWVAAANSMGFHSPVEALRVLSTSIEKSYQARILLQAILTKSGVLSPYKLPDYSTKEKAQKLIGLDIKKIEQEKAGFKKNIIPKWTKDTEAEKGKN